MSTSKAVEVANASGADAVVREIAKAENKFQEELNRAFVQLAEGSFKGLRRQLPVTRQRVEWEKIGGYRVSLASPTGGNDRILTFCLARPGHRRWTLEVGSSLQVSSLESHVKCDCQSLSPVVSRHTCAQGVCESTPLPSFVANSFSASQSITYILTSNLLTYASLRNRATRPHISIHA